MGAVGYNAKCVNR